MYPASTANRIALTLGAGLLTCLGVASTAAQPAGSTTDSAITDLARCARITTDAVRLACFDALARETGQRPGAEAAAPGPVERATSDAPGEDGNEDAFGAELLGEREAFGLDEIESRLIGEFTGWRGNTTFRLENGQVWRQAETGRLVFRANAPSVTIRRGAFGTYRLSVEGVNRTIRVRRVE